MCEGSTMSNNEYEWQTRRRDYAAERKSTRPELTDAGEAHPLIQVGVRCRGMLRARVL